MSWAQKYKPEKLNDIKGQGENLAKLKEFVLKKQPVIIHGKPGVGKTSSAYALANELDYEILEVNASTLRNKENMQRVVGGFSKQKSLFNKEKIVLIDEVDGFNRNDRGGATVLLDVLKEKNYAIILTANNPYQSKISNIRKLCKLIEYKIPDYHSIFAVLNKIIKVEKLKVEDKFLREIIVKCNGDIRAAINDLQSYNFGERKTEKSIFEILNEVFKNKSWDVLNIFNSSKLNLDECFLWIDENLPKEYSREDLANAYEVMSKVDIFKGRIIKQNYWRYLVYISALMSVGIAYAKRNINKNFVKYERTKRILKLWLAKQRNVRRKLIAYKIAKLTHTSSKNIINNFRTYKFLNSRGVDLNLDEEEVEWMKNWRKE